MWNTGRFIVVHDFNKKAVGQKSTAKVLNVAIGVKFIFSAADFGLKIPPSMEGKELTVVGFKPRYKNNVVLRDPSGHELLMPLDMVEAALAKVAYAEVMDEVDDEIQSIDDEVQVESLKDQILVAEACDDTKRARELRKELRPIRARMKLRKLGIPAAAGR